jgi:hypothetical protein
MRHLRGTGREGKRRYDLGLIGDLVEEQDLSHPEQRRATIAEVVIAVLGEVLPPPQTRVAHPLIRRP